MTLYRARALMVDDGVITAYVPQVFGDTPIRITDTIGELPSGPSTGWVMFESGATEFPVWTTGAVTAGPEPAPEAPDTTGGLRSLLIFYAPLNVINLRYNDDYAAGVIARYDDVVLPTGLEDPASPSYSSTVAVMQKVASLNPSTVMWGYIDTGRSTGNFPLDTLKMQIDQWMAIGAGGIFCDVIGYAYGVERSRQNDIINYIHSKGVGGILNVWNPHETLGSQVDPIYNPDGIPTVADARDVLLLESWVCNSDAYPDPYYATFSDLKTRADIARVYRDTLGIKLFASSIIQYTGRTDAQIEEYRDMSEALARVFRMDGSGLAASSYSSTGADVGLVRPSFSKFQPIPLRPEAPYILNGTWTEVEAPDLGILVHFDATTHTWVQR